MANKIIETDLRPRDFVPQTSRYIGLDVIYYYKNNEKKLAFKTYKKGEYLPNDQDRFTTISATMEYRPDLVSFTAYGVVDFWWKIMEANNIKDIFDFKAGKTIKLPANVF